MSVETFDPKKAVNKTTTLETPVKVLNETKPSTSTAGNRIGFVSLGCPKNLVDSERILTQLRTEGYDVVPTYNDADLVIVNTCGFIDAAVEESLDTIGEALKENGKVIVTGCLGSRDNTIREKHPQVLEITGAHALEEVVSAVHKHLPPQHDPFVSLVPPEGIKLTPRHYAYLKISEGCNLSNISSSFLCVSDLSILLAAVRACWPSYWKIFFTIVFLMRNFKANDGI